MKNKEQGGAGLMEISAEKFVPFEGLNQEATEDEISTADLEQVLQRIEGTGIDEDVPPDSTFLQPILRIVAL